jgi:hypothetical protein
LIESIQAGRASLDARLVGLDEAAMIRPGVQGEWSVKDLLAHLVFWEGGMVENLKRAVRGEVPQYPSGELDDINAQVFAENRQRPLEAVLAESRQSFEALLAQVQGLPEEDLIDPGRFAWTEGKPLWEYIAGESFEHIREHLQDLP